MPSALHEPAGSVDPSCMLAKNNNSRVLVSRFLPILTPEVCLSLVLCQISKCWVRFTNSNEKIDISSTKVTFDARPGEAALDPASAACLFTSVTSSRRNEVPPFACHPL